MTAIWLGCRAADRLDLQAAVLKLHGVVAVHDPLVVEREDEVEVLRPKRQEGGPGLLGGHLEAAVERGDIGPVEKAVGRLDGLDVASLQLLRQPSLPGEKAGAPSGPAPPASRPGSSG